MTTPHVVGIDFGFCTTRITLLEASRKMPIVLRNSLSHEATATVISYPPENARLYGDNAAAKEVARPTETVGDMVTWLRNETRSLRSVGDHEELAAPQAAGYFLSEILRFVPKSVDLNTVLTYAVAAAGEVTEDVARAYIEAFVVSGVPKEKVLVLRADEACCAYYHHLKNAELPATPEASPQGQVAVIVDVGHSGMSVVALRAWQNRLEKLASAFRPIGSAQLDDRLSHLVFDEVEAKQKKSDLRTHLKSFRKVLREARKAKESLSSGDRATVQADSLKDDVNVSVTITKKQLEQQAAELVEVLSAMLAEVRAKLPADADPLNLRVEAIGAAWRIPILQEAIKGAFGIQRIGVSLDSNLAVAEGTAILATILKSGCQAAEGSPRDAIHDAELVNFAVPSSSVLELSADTQRWVDTETQLAKSDDVIHQRVVALNAIEAFILQTQQAAEECKTIASEKKKDLRQFLEVHDHDVRDGCEGKTTEQLQQQLADIQKEITSKFPEIEELYAQRRAEQQAKDDELVRLSKLQEEDKELKSDPQRLRAAQQRREQGQTLFKQECFAEAQTRFVQALAILGQLYDTQSPENKSKKDEISLSCYLNIASCSVKLGVWRNAINNCTNALELSPNNAKALFRRGQAYCAINEFACAKIDLEKAKELASGDAAIVAELEAVVAKEGAQKAKEKKMFSKMFS